MYDRRMKFTLNIDDALLAGVMKSTGAKTKTEAIHAALAEIERRHKLIDLLSEDVGINWETDIDTTAWDREAAASARVAEAPPKSHDRKPRPRR